MSLLQVSDLHHEFGSQKNLSEISFSLDHGERLTLLGASGSGKSSLLKCIAGFWQLSKGEIHLRDQLVASSKVHRHPADRGIGFLFQEPSLFPHLNIQSNIEFGLSKSQSRANGLLETLVTELSLRDLLDRYPHQLSGGQRQKVSLARTLVMKPDLLLMDEPFSSLDESFVSQFVPSLNRLLDELSCACIYVTHRLSEAGMISDRVGLMQGGVLQQVGSLQTVYQNPSSPYAAEFMGRGFFVEAEAKGSQWMTDLGPVSCQGMSPKTQRGRAFFRPEDLKIDARSSAVARVMSREFLGDRYLITAQLNGNTIFVYEKGGDQSLELGSGCPVSLEKSTVPIFVVAD